MKRSILVFAILILPTVLAEEFPNQNSNSGFVGWQESQDEKIGEFRLSYPAVSDGEEVAMAQNGPFAVLVFFTDDGEGVQQYEWLQDGISLWGYITLVVEDETGFDSIDYTLQGWNNGTIFSVPGAQGMFALDHISVAGHGTGAHTAAELMKSTDYSIDGLFGLGLDGTSTDYSESVILSRPSSALFLTGTADNIASANENVIPYLNSWPGAWQVMYVRGANHIGYQETDTFLERLVDGESAMGREGQQNHALQHILPYLNLSLRGDDSAYQQAFNREDKTVSSDTDAYIDEDLSRSRLYKMENISSTLMSVMLNQSFTISADVTMRDGSNAIGNVTCITPDGDAFEGTLESGIASCEINGSSLSPGPSLIELQVSDNSFSDWLNLFINRIGMPMEIVQPIPEIVLDQHSNVTITAETFAVDPDGEELQFASAEIVGENESKLSVSINSTDLVIAHVADQEWDGHSQLNFTLITSDESVDLVANITVLPVDDPVYQTATIPQQTSIEDGSSIVVDFAEFVSDPEGQTLVVNAVRDYPGIRIVSTQSTVLIDPQTHWNGAELIEFYVSDGNTESLQIVVPINIQPVDDKIEFTSESFSIELDEDSVRIINLENFTINVDDDQLQFTIDGQSELIEYSLSGTELTIVPKPNLFGDATYTLNVSDGYNSTTATLNININSVPDLPIVGISSIDHSGNVLSILWTISDEDGDAGLIYSVMFANNSIEQNTDCTGSTLLTCLTTTNTNQEGTHSVEVKVWDGNAQQWSNVASGEIKIESMRNVVEESDSGLELGEWIIPVGAGIILLMLVGYVTISRKD